MENGFEFSTELLSALCKQCGVEYSKDYSYNLIDIPGGVKLRVSDPQTGEQVNDVVTYLSVRKNNDYLDIEKDILNVRNKTIYTKQCINIIYSILLVGLLTSGIIILLIKYM